MEKVARAPRTDRGRRTLRVILDAARTEFGERGFHDTSIVAITARAGVALGSFYTYFESKEAVFRALVEDMSRQVGQMGSAAARAATGGIATEQAVCASFIGFAREHRELYRIIDEAEFVDPPSYRAHYEAAAGRIGARLRAGVDAGELRDVGEVEAWAIMGMNVFLGLRYGVLADDGDPADIGARVGALLARGLVRELARELAQAPARDGGANDGLCGGVEEPEAAGGVPITIPSPANPRRNPG